MGLVDLCYTRLPVRSGYLALVRGGSHRVLEPRCCRPDLVKVVVSVGTVSAALWHLRLALWILTLFASDLVEVPHIDLLLIAVSPGNGQKQRAGRHFFAKKQLKRKEMPMARVSTGSRNIFRVQDIKAPERTFVVSGIVS